MQNKYTPCGGCGATDPMERCIGCFHPFESTPKPQPKIETVTWLNLADHFTEDWETMHCRYADDKRKLDTDLFELSDGWLVKKGGTGKLELHEVEYMADEPFNPDLLKVMQEAEATKESDLQKVKEEIGKCPECGAPCKLIDRAYQEQIHDVHYTEHVYQPPAEAEGQTGPRWVKADQKPEHNVGVLVFIPGEDNHITSGMWDVSNEWVLLDEYRTPEEEVTHWMALPGLPEGVEPNELPDEWVRELKKIARDELGPDERGL